MPLNAAFPADDGLPGLAAACDPDRMAALLRRHLRPRAGARIAGCRLEELRHRRGARSVLRYRLTLADGPAPWSWAVGVLYGGEARAGRAAALAQALARSAPADLPPDLLPFGPVAHLPEIDMLVQVFPFDRRLPGLAGLAGGPPPALAALLAGGAADGGADAGWTSEPVRYRPQLRATLRYTLHAEPPRRFYVKFDPAGRDRDAALAERAAERLGAAGFAVPRPLAVLPEHDAAVLAEVPGVPLDRLLETVGQAAPAARAVARALARFNRGPAALGRPFTAADELAGLERAAALVRWARPDLDRAARRVASRVGGALGHVRPGPAHGDLKADHLLFDRGRPGVVDLGSCCDADPMLDPGVLLARLFGLPLERPGARAGAAMAMRAFADEYLALVPRSWRSRLDAHYSGALLELAASLFKRQVAGWPDAVGALVAEAGRCR